MAVPVPATIASYAAERGDRARRIPLAPDHSKNLKCDDLLHS